LSFLIMITGTIRYLPRADVAKASPSVASSAV
jgi:hypothetical protein